MKKSIFAGCIVASLLPHITTTKSIVTNGGCGGRLGDQLINYSKVKWLAYKYDLEFFYTPFEYSDHLMLHELEKPYSSVAAKPYKKIAIKHEHKIIKSYNNIFYATDYFLKLDGWTDWDQGHFPFVRDQKFIEELRRCIRPRYHRPQLEIPRDMITVAVHVRKGGGFDKPLITEQAVVTMPADIHHYVDIDFPLKFPPDQYYIDQIRKISELYSDRPLYVHLFTDDQDPQRLADKYSQALNNPNIIFGFRKNDNKHNAHVVEDFFAMLQFNCLIRTDSSYSKAAHLIGNFKLVIYPQHYVWQGHTMIIDKVIIWRPEGEINEI